MAKHLRFSSKPGSPSMLGIPHSRRSCGSFQTRYALMASRRAAIRLASARKPGFVERADHASRAHSSKQRFADHGQGLVPADRQSSLRAETGGAPRKRGKSLRWRLLCRTRPSLSARSCHPPRNPSSSAARETCKRASLTSSSDSSRSAATMSIMTESRWSLRTGWSASTRSCLPFCGLRAPSISAPTMRLVRSTNSSRTSRAMI